MKHPDGIQGYIDAPGSGQDMFQVPVYRGRIQRIDFSDVDNASFPLNVRSDVLKLGERLSSDEDPCSFASECPRGRAANRSTATVYNGSLTLQQHRRLASN
jgi:hypothetical protein